MSSKKTQKVVVIGGGIGGLTAAAYLAQAGVDVELFEQHYRLGGCCTSFKRRQYIFDAAVHTIPGCTPGGIIHDAFEELGRRGEHVGGRFFERCHGTLFRRLQVFLVTIHRSSRSWKNRSESMKLEKDGKITR